MSYLLTGKGKAKGFGGTSSKRPASVSRSHGGFRRTTGGVGGQVQKMRPPQHKQRVAPPNHLKQQQQQQSREQQQQQQQQQQQPDVQSLLSMEEGECKMTVNELLLLVLFILINY